MGWTMKTLREAFDYRFSRLDPMGAHIDPPSVAIYESLLAKGPDRQPHSSLARVTQVSESQLVWTLQLRPGAQFHSGDTCDAPAVVDSLEALRWHTGADRQLWYWDPVDTVVPLDERTLRFTLHYPYRRLPSLLWGTHTAIFNRSAQLRDPDSFGVSVADGTGPYKLRSLSRERIVAERWDAYPGVVVPGTRGAFGSVDRIEWLSILDPRDRLTALLTGDVHCLHGPPYEELPSLEADPRFTVYEAGQASSMYLSLNWRRREFGFDDLRVRQAISLAIDRPSLVSKALHGHGRPTWGPLPPGTEYYHPAIDEAGGHDAGRAARELDRLGWQCGADGIRTREGHLLAFECVVQRDPIFEAVAAEVASQLLALGIRLDIKTVEPFADFYEACEAAPASSISKWLWPDPVDALIGFSSTSTAPFPNWSNASVPNLDAAFEAWLHADTDQELAAAASRVQWEFVRGLPYIPLLTPNDVWVWSTQVEGFAPSPHILYPMYQGVDLAQEVGQGSGR